MFSAMRRAFLWHRIAPDCKAIEGVADMGYAQALAARSSVQ